jgi:peptidoglycan/LPS O-acetylase OafA/YrhL
MRTPDGEVRAELRPLTSLRFLAAFLVFLYHCPATSSFATRYALGHAGVGFFFVLSGFILTYTYHRTFEAGVVWPRVRDFYAARIARIYPAYALSTLIALVVLLLFGNEVWRASTVPTREIAFVAQILLIQSWIPVEQIYLGINSPAWSLSTEMLFYAIFPLVAHTLLRYFRAASAWKIGLAAALIWSFQTALSLTPPRVSVWGMYVFPPERLVDFTVGMLGAIAYLGHRGWASRWRATAVEVTAIGAVAGCIAVSPHLPEAIRYSLYLVPAWAALIIVMARGDGQIARLLRAPIFVRLGQVSFAFYLLQWSVVAALTGALAHSSALGFVVMFAVTLAGSFAMYHAVEQPLRLRLRSALSTEVTHLEPATIG